MGVKQEPDVEQVIRATGRRVTMQRAKILRALRGLPGHSTAEQIYARVCEDDPRAEMALSTVYRTLDALAEMEIVTAFIDGGGVATFEWATDETPHHHLLCDGCGHVEEVVLKAVGGLREEVERTHGFAADIRHLAIRGQCARCRAEAKPRGDRP